MSDGDAATAFAPGHVTGFFSAHPDDDPTKAGSRGAGITLSEGVTVRLEAGDGLELNGESAFPNAFDEPAAQQAVLDAVSGFIESSSGEDGTATPTPSGDDEA